MLFFFFHQVSQDLSPIYEEIHGCSRSSVSSGSSSNRSTSNSSTTSSSSGDRGKFFYSLYDFEATDATMLSAKRGQVLRVIQSASQPGGSGSSEWCYVEDRHGNKGYVPISYLNSYQDPQSAVDKTAAHGSNSNLQQVKEEQ